MEPNNIPCDDPSICMSFCIAVAISGIDSFSTKERENNLSNTLILKALVPLLFVAVYVHHPV